MARAGCCRVAPGIGGQRLLNMPQVDLIIPAYNAGKYLRATLDSVLAQSHTNFQVWVINDGSRDDTETQALSTGDPRVHVISRPNAGMSASRNLAASLGQGEFLALLDADDLWHPDKLKHQLQALEARPDHDFCFTAFTWWWGEERPSFFLEPRSGMVDEHMSGWIYHHLVLDNHALPSSVLLRRSAWNQLGPFLCENQRTDDWEYLVRASTQHRFVRLAESYVLYRQLTSSLSKAVAATNEHETMRSHLLSRFGMQAPVGEGTPVDAQALAEYQYRGHSNFADQHCARGRLGLGLRCFATLIWRGPRRGHSLLRLAKSLFRRVFPKQVQV